MLCQRHGNGIAIIFRFISPVTTHMAMEGNVPKDTLHRPSGFVR